MLVMEEKKPPVAGEPAAPPPAAEPDDADAMPPAGTIETPAERAYREVMERAEVRPGPGTVRNMLGRSFE